jgi:hypothetical protein
VRFFPGSFEYPVDKKHFTFHDNINKTLVFQAVTSYCTDRAAQLYYAFIAHALRLQTIVLLFKLCLSFAEVLVEMNVCRSTLWGGFQIMNRATNFSETQYGNCTNRGNHRAVVFNLLYSVITTWKTPNLSGEIDTQLAVQS